MNGQKESKRSKFSSILLEFCQRSTIHGIGNVADQNRHWIERFGWMIAISVLTVYCLSGFYGYFIRWMQNPLCSHFDKVPLQVGDVPFPAVSICPLTRSDIEKFNYTAAYLAVGKFEPRNITSEELKVLSVMSQYCDRDVASKIINFLPDEHMDEATFYRIKEIAPKMKETFVFCNLFGKSHKCDELFRPIITESGLCYAFNIFNMNEMITDEVAPDILNQTLNQPPSNWVSDSGYMGDGSFGSYPYRTYGSGARFSLQVGLRALTKNIDPLCGGGVQGFTVTFHPPNEFPQVFKRLFHVALGKTVSFSVEPSIAITPDNVRNYKPETRHCFLATERPLRFYKQYTPHNCEMECWSNFTAAKCGCVGFAMARDNDTKICGALKFQNCLLNNNSTTFKTENLVECNCMSLCATLSYSAYSSEADYEHQYATLECSDEHDTEEAEYSRLSVSFKEEWFTPTERYECFSLIDLLSNWGGLFGLFMGASLLSIVELVYYFSLRLFLSYRNDNDDDDTNRPELILFEPQRPVRRQPPPNQTIVFTFLP